MFSLRIFLRPLGDNIVIPKNVPFPVGDIPIFTYLYQYLHSSLRAKERFA